MSRDLGRRLLSIAAIGLAAHFLTGGPLAGEGTVVSNMQSYRQVVANNQGGNQLFATYTLAFSYGNSR